MKIIGLIGQPVFKVVDDDEAQDPDGWCVMQSEPPTQEHFNIDGEWKLPIEFITV